MPGFWLQDKMELAISWVIGPQTAGAPPTTLMGGRLFSSILRGIGERGSEDTARFLLARCPRATERS